MPKSYLHQQKLKFFTLFQYDELIIKSFFSSEKIEACLIDKPLAKNWKKPTTNQAQVSLSIMAMWS